MAVYKIFPEKDTYISSKYPNDNFGRDEILEISNHPDNIRESLLFFDIDNIQDLIDSLNIKDYQVYLKLYLSRATITSDEYSLNTHILADDFQMGTGRSGDFPNPQNGVTYNNINYLILFSLDHPFYYSTNKDINVEITQLVENGVNEGILNILLNYDSGTSENYQNTDYFSMDTHTIYPPHIELKWNDSIYSSSINEISNNFYTDITNLKSDYYEDEEVIFRIKSRDVFPTRNFQTSSLYLNSKILPKTSYWSIEDIKTNEVIINFDEEYTKISADNNGNYFKTYMNGLQPERYYKILIKTIINDEIIIKEIPNYFKIKSK